MLEVLQRTAHSAGQGPAVVSAVTSGALVAGWREGLAIVNLRGSADDAAFCQAAASALGVPLPTKAGTTSESSVARVVWAGPDDWFIVGPKGHADALGARLREALRGLHHAVTDVSSGYTVLHLSGTPARDVLAQGCPLDLHPRAFVRGGCAGSHFFKASVWLWQTADAPEYELLVRRSFMGYVWLMLERASAECGLVTRRFA
ncbi:MAG TPA: sarcosine oxidase subunit gamma family protein [Burkholderiaceae bacterium]|nr:sarcosine oxidase subunit gamma family protein [Burkholderiaceae bacterium]